MRYALPIILHQPTISSNQLTWLFRTFNSWTLAIKNACSPRAALKLYVQMQRQSLSFESFTILFTLKACAPPQHLSLIRHLHAHLFKLGFNSNVYVATSLLHSYSAASFGEACQLFDEMPVRNRVSWNTMITGFSRCGDVEKGRQLFDQMPVKDLVSWSAMIGGYIDNGFWKEGLALFREMVANGEDLRPDQLTTGSVLGGCAHMGPIGLRLGKSIHGFIVRKLWKLNVLLGSCLVNMYAKCGFLKNSCLVFDMMEDRNVVTWTAIICGAAHHGFGKEALLIFEKMKKAHVKPNELTFTGVLSACAQAGLVEEGRGYFKMIEEHGLKAGIEHYGCMVDLFGKAGLLGEAYEVINAMMFEPNVVIWGSFLSSCKLFKQFEMAEKVIERIMRTVRPENDAGIYSQICDIYVLSEKWGEAKRVRELMLSQNVRKARGSSFV